MGPDPVGELAARERHLAHEQVIEGAAEGVDVGAAVGLVAVAGLLGREVVGGAQHLLAVFLRQRAVVLPLAGERQPEVEDLDGAALVEDQVGRLDVAMDDTLLVGVVEAEGRLPDGIHGVANRQRSLLLDLRVEIGAVDVLHRQVVDGAGGVEVERPHDVVMGEPERLAGLALEPGEIRRLVHVLHREHLDRHLAVEVDVLGQVDAAHAPRPEEAEQPVLPQHEAPVLALAELVHLPLREQFGVDEPPHELLGQRLRPVGPRGRNLLQPGLVHEAALSHDGEKIVDGMDGVRHADMVPRPFHHLVAVQAPGGPVRTWRQVFQPAECGLPTSACAG